MKKKKTNKKIASALAMLMLSAAMLGTSTYAWFTMNKRVEVTGMENVIKEMKNDNVTNEPKVNLKFKYSKGGQITLKLSV